MLRFYFDAQKAQDGIVVLEEKESRHALRVLRAKAGEAVELLDGKGKSYPGFVVGEENGRLRVQLNANAGQERTHSVPLSLVCGVVKPDAMDWIVQKACELGVSEIRPILTERSVVKIPAVKWPARISRWQRIAEESCKQCGLTAIPKVHAITNVETAATSPDFEKTLIPTLAVKGCTLKAALKQVTKSVRVMIGPEGDFTPKEVDAAVKKGAVPVSLGPLVMRSETAALYTLSALRFHFDEAN